MSNGDEAHKQAIFQSRSKSSVVAYIFWFFLGTLGLHNFYLGRKGPAIAQLILGIIGWVTIWLLFGLIILIPLWIWLIVELFFIYKWVERHNLKLADQVFKPSES